MDGLEANPCVVQRLLHLRSLVPHERDRDAAVRADLTRAGNEARRQARALQRPLPAHCVLRREEGHDSSPLQATVPKSALRSRATIVRTAPTAVSMSASLVSWLHEKRSVPSGAVPSERCAAG